MKPKQLSNKLRDIAKKIDNSIQPSRHLVAMDITRLIANLRIAAGDQHSIEQALYGHTAETDPHRGVGSSIWWSVFDAMDMADWIPTTDYSKVEERAQELIEKWQPWKGMPGREKHVQKLIVNLRQNWQTYQKRYMPEHIKILKEKGLM